MRKSSIASWKIWSYATSVILSMVVIFLVVSAATTISNNISTGGTLAATGATTLSSTLSVADVSTFAGFISTASSTAVAAFNVDGLTTSRGGVVVNNATSTITNLVTVNATSTNATTTSLSVTTVASTTNLVVGGNGTTIAGMIAGFCNIATAVTVNASSTAFADCNAATGIRANDRVFVMATSSLPNALIVQAASSTAASTINLRILNTGYNNGTPSGNVSTGVISLNFWAVR